MRDQQMQRPESQQSGFTLVEIMLALVIAAMVFTAIFGLVQVGVNVQIDVREITDSEQVGPAILAQLSEDLRNAYYYNIAENDFLHGRPVEADGEARTDQIHFLTTRTSLLADTRIISEDGQDYSSPLTEVSYVCKQSPDGYYELHRREQHFCDEEPFRGGYYRMITDRLISFRIQYYGYNFGADEDAEETSNAESENESATEDEADEPFVEGLLWEDEWASTLKGSLPIAVKIELIVAPDIDPDVRRRMERSGRTDALEKSYSHIVLMPQFREDRDLIEQTYAWDGTVSEPTASGGGVAGGGAGRGGAGRGGGRGRGGDTKPGAGGRGGAGGAGGRGGQGANGRPPTNALQNLLGGARPASGNNPFLQLLQGGGR